VETGSRDDSYFEGLMAPVDHALYVPGPMLDPPPVAVLPGARSHLQVPYAEIHGWRALRLDVHLPDSAGPGPWPVAVYVHGGSFLTGLPGMGPWAALPGRGIAVVSVTYRFSGETTFPAPVEDVRAAVDWVRARADRYGLDPTRIALWGGSAGGYLAALVAVTPDRPIARTPRLLGVESPAPGERASPAAVVTQYALTDPALLRADALPGTETAADQLIRAVSPFFGDGPTPRAVLDHLRNAHGVPPFLVMHGGADQRVGVGQGRRLHEGLVRAGVPSTFRVLPDADHGTAEWSHSDVVDLVVDHLATSWHQ
jgi:acetyl esterase/lipase